MWYAIVGTDVENSLTARTAARPAHLARLEALRDAGLRVAVHGGSDMGVDSFKSQMKKADASGARFAIILGSDEITQQKLTVKDLQGGGQVLLSEADAVAHIRMALSAA